MVIIPSSIGSSKLGSFPMTLFWKQKNPYLLLMCGSVNLKGKDLITKGALWRVDDGKGIKIWGDTDNWLPTINQSQNISSSIWAR